ncbi:MAG: hypoxanthine phosphoribosyltransferase, partial [Bacteroidales bacterium]|nr:hypoxanthine phosphoribosyltransferase [Bacteroidales bacterium]
DILSGIDKVSEKLNEDFKDKSPVFICVLNGAFMFASELIGKFKSDCEVTFIRIKSYKGTQRNENRYEVHGLLEDIKDRHVVIVEDIIDTGYTMNDLLQKVREKNPLTIRTATLLFKPDALKINIQPDYAVREIPNDFIVGFRLDYEGLGRNLRNIYKIKSLD